jgi:hypothetical protein
MNFSLFTHGTGLVMEDGAGVAQFEKKGWGAVITFVPPTPPDEHGFTQDRGQGSWFHLPITSTTHFFGERPSLVSVVLQFILNRSRITIVDVYDGPNRIERLPRRGVTSLPDPSISPGETLVLSNPVPVVYGIGISFFAYWHSEDLGKDAEFDGQALFLGAGGANFHVDDPKPKITVSGDSVNVGTRPTVHQG